MNVKLDEVMRAHESCKEINLRLVNRAVELQQEIDRLLVAVCAEKERLEAGLRDLASNTNAVEAAASVIAGMTGGSSVTGWDRDRAVDILLAASEAALGSVERSGK